MGRRKGMRPIMIRQISVPFFHVQKEFRQEFFFDSEMLDEVQIFHHFQYETSGFFAKYFPRYERERAETFHVMFIRAHHNIGNVLIVHLKFFLKNDT